MSDDVFRQLFIIYVQNRTAIRTVVSHLALMNFTYIVVVQQIFMAAGTETLSQ